jgi:hypothetical protein
LKQELFVVCFQSNSKKENCEEVKSSIYCSDCCMSFCENCSSIFHKKKKTHKLTHMEEIDILKLEKKIYCEEHNIEADFFCETDDEFICSKCVLIELDGKHSLHRRIKIQELSGKIEQNFKKQMDELKKVEDKINLELKTLKKSKLEAMELLKKLENQEKNSMIKLNKIKEFSSKEISKMGKRESLFFIKTCSSFINDIYGRDGEFNRLEVFVSTLKFDGLEESVIFYDILHDSPELGSLDNYKAVAKEKGYQIPKWEHPGDGASYSSNRKTCTNYKIVRDYYEKYLTKKYRDLDIASNVLLAHSSDPGCWAFESEEGCFSAFGGADGGGYSYCRGGDKIKKRLHIYLFLE